MIFVILNNLLLYYIKMIGCTGGVYFLRFSKSTIKIGMSRNQIHKRLRSYRGYHPKG